MPPRPTPNTPTTGPELLTRVRAGFVSNGSTLTAWCRENGIHHSNARQALLGAWDGPAGKTLRRRLLKAAGINSNPEVA